MSDGKALLKVREAIISRGSVFRVPGKYPYEEVVDFMVFETFDVQTPYGLMVTSGYKAGLTLVLLPRESLVEGGISRNWVIENWREWVYPDCDVSDVCFLSGYKAPSLARLSGKRRENKNELIKRENRKGDTH